MNKWIPIIIIALAGLLTWAMIQYQPEAEKVPVEQTVIVVECVVAKAAPHTLTLQTSGVVRAPTTTELTAEVVGKITEINPVFESGRFFEKDDWLLRIEPVDYEAELVNARANLAEAEYTLELEKAESEQARTEWALLGKGEPTAMTLRLPQLARAEAAIESARATVKRALRNLERTCIKAPYRGRVQARTVNLGQYIGTLGTPLGIVYATDFAEVRLPITDRQASLMELPVQYDGSSRPVTPLPMVLELTFGSERYQWEGFVDRMEGVVDDQTRLFHIVGRVPEPYRQRSEGQPPLQIGMYAQALVQGKSLDKAFVLPRLALFEKDKVLIAGANDTLEIRPVQVAQSEGDQVVILSGLETGERVIVTPLDYVVNGMHIKPLEAGAL